MAIWDDYQQTPQTGWTPPPGIEGYKAQPKVTPGNKAWQDANNPQPTPNNPTPPNSGDSAQPVPNDPIQAAAQAGQQAAAPYRTQPQSNFPAANQFSLPQNTAFARNAPINTIAQNLNQIPIGGFGLGALSQAGYSRSPQMNLGNFMNQGLNQQPRQLPATTLWTQPGVNADIRALSDPSVGALDNARRSMNTYGQTVINPSGGGQIISGQGPSFGALEGSTRTTNTQGQTMLNTPSGGTAIGGPSLRKPMDKLTPGQTWSLGGWY